MATAKTPKTKAKADAPASGGKMLCGLVGSGLGEGAKFLSMPEYRKQFNLLLGFRPFPGTLNLTIAKPEELTEFVVGLDEERGSGFKHEGRSFGGLSMYEVMIKKKGARGKNAAGVAGALVVPDKSHRTGVAELVAETSLRETLGLDDGDELCVTPKSAIDPAGLPREPLQEVVEQAPPQDDTPAPSEPTIQ